MKHEIVVEEITKTLFTNTWSSIALAILVLLLLTKLLFKINRRLVLTNRIAAYIIKDKTEINPNLLKFWQFYLGGVNLIDQLLISLKIEPIKLYTKYYKTINKVYHCETSYLSEKILILVLVIVLNILLPLPYIFGFLLYCFIIIIIETNNYFKYVLYMKKLNNDFNQAISIMANAFKSGKSILQAVELIAVNEANLLKKDFRIIVEEIKTGIGIDEAFQRFAKRTTLKEAFFLATVMTILMKSGGHINDMFARMQHRLFNKKEIELEIRAITSGLKISAFVFSLMPLILITVFYLFNPAYFEPLISNTIGQIILLIIVNLYLFYLIMLKKTFTIEVN